MGLSTLFVTRWEKFMNCDICEYLKIMVRGIIDTNSRTKVAEVRQLAHSHYSRFHPNPFDQALDEENFMNP